jgi:hypothetical protein
MGVFATDAWTSVRRAPPLYPDAVTLEPGVVAPDLLTRIDTRPGCSVKDSFADLDLSADGFTILISAEWIHRPAQPAAPDATPSVNWAPIVDDAELDRWSAAGAQDGDPRDLFRPALIPHPDVVMLGGYLDGTLVAGALVNRSPTVVGLSNVFPDPRTLADAWTGLLATIAELFPGLPIVGYESGDSLAAARDHEFTSLGPLRIWIKSD